MKTEIGEFIQDSSGLWHYKHTRAAGHVKSAAADAINHRIAPAWFWFNDTLAPIYPSDDVNSLVERWQEWRRDYQSGKLLDRLQTLTLSVETTA